MIAKTSRHSNWAETPVADFCHKKVSKELVKISKTRNSNGTYIELNCITSPASYDDPNDFKSIIRYLPCGIFPETQLFTRFRPKSGPGPLGRTPWA